MPELEKLEALVNVVLASLATGAWRKLWGPSAWRL
jgi:hypothetical protein